jgi:heat-inducible transcriptional repressor
MITERQEKILNSVVQEYIDSVQPVGSQLLERKHKFGVSAATIRNEMQRLTDKGFLSQPHTSAGRVPTDKGYRFFVDRLLEKELEEFAVNWEREIKAVWSSGASLGFIREVTKFLAEESSNLALGYLSADKILWKEGWREIFQEPEFSQAGYAAKFTQMLDDFERNIDKIDFPSEIRVYIGRENPISRNRDFSLMTMGFPKGLFALLGPKRMSYDKNIDLFCRLCRKI